MSIFNSQPKGILDANTATRLKNRCLSAYQDAVNYEETDVSESVRLRLANRARINIDMTFVDAAEKTEAYEDERLKLFENGQSDSHIKEPEHNNSYQIVKTGEKNIFTYIPDEYSKEVFKIGCSFQRSNISEAKAVLVGNSILQNICADLNVIYNIPVFRFLDQSPQEELLDENDEDKS